MRGRGVLVLAGTAEARAVLARARGLAVLASLAGRTAAPVDLGVPTRTGGFGGEAGFRAALAEATAVLDATHPFAARMTERAVRICGNLGVPYLRLTRPGWGALGQRYADERACARALPAGATVFLTTGPGSLPAFEGRGLRLLCRRVDPAPARAGVTWIVGMPPFALAQEMETLRTHGVTDLVTKDSGGARAKLDAAATLGVAVHVIDRPASPGGEETHDIERAVAFLRRYGTPGANAPNPRP
ncbi:MAG: precorrin-6A/cobalt-precorrin-6A reductase [Pseudomonadota bacterium]